MISASTDASVSAQKAALRLEMRMRRAALTPDQRADFSRRITDNLMALDAQIGQPQRAAIYLATPQEANVDAFACALWTRNAEVFAPRNDGFAPRNDGFAPRNDGFAPRNDGFAPLANLKAVALGRFGTREPIISSDACANIDCVLLPGLAFDLQGGRLGQGGGWYDRVLPQMKPDIWRIGVCFECQVVESVPRENHDQDVHFLVTETQICTFSNP